MNWKNSIIAAALCAAAALIPVPALAHAHLDRAMPAPNSVQATAPKDVTIWFTEALEAKFSSIVVQDAKGLAVHAGPAALVSGNTAQLRVQLKAMPPGTYKVIWKVLSVDTHRSNGEFSFKVGP
ncbi:MAG: copper resistance protein CopC [Pseudolabrys sp.]|nr:copper resistance protein CopC [Pseudolabrys sp.]